MKILFVCKGNMFRSPMAEAIASKILGKGNVMSAGTYTGAPDEPEGLEISKLSHMETFIKYMKDKGSDLYPKKTVRVTKDMVDKANIIIDMAEEEYDSELLRNNPKVIKWEVENPIFQNYSPQEAYKKTEEIYNILNQNIQGLLASYKSYCAV